MNEPADSNRGPGSQHDAGCRALILAAGLGTRLRPVTEHLPKPLLPVLGKPLLSIIADQLFDAGVDGIAVNTHHLPEMIAAYLETINPGNRFTVSHEPDILGTGGALVGARTFLERDESFLLYNGDVLCDFDPRILIAEHRQGGALATLVLTDWPRVNSVVLCADGSVGDLAGKLDRPGARGDRHLTYTGIAAISREVFQYLPTGFSSLIDALIDAMSQQPGIVRGCVPESMYWNDLGTVGRWLDVHAQLLHGDQPGLVERLLDRDRYRDLNRSADDPSQLVARTAQIDPGANLTGFCVVEEEVTVGPGCSLRDCLVLARTRLAADTELHDAVAGPGWLVTRDQNTVLGARIVRAAGFDDTSLIQPITGHGSDRLFWRLRRNDRSAVLMKSPPTDEEFERFIAIGEFLHETDLGGPQILAADHAERLVLMTDQGEHSLYDLIGTGQIIDAGEIERLYEAVIDLLVELQVRGTILAERCPAAGDRLFDYQILRWETDYFRQRFLHDLVGIESSDLAALDEDFDNLANAALNQPVVLMHRDFQSQNIMVQLPPDGSRPLIRLVDFQGMRRGPLGYDLMSLLRDAYIDLDAVSCAGLREYYRRRLNRMGGPDPTSLEMRAMTTVAGLQRNLQALGAFGFLSIRKKKPHFQRHIPLCWQHLKSGLAELSELHELCSDPAKQPGGESTASKLMPLPLNELQRVVDIVDQRRFGGQ